MDFKPIFFIRQNLGYLADKLKRFYNSTTIGNDSAKKNIESIILTKSSMRSYISYSTFRVVQLLTTESNNDFSSMEIEIGKISDRLANLANKFESYKKNRTGRLPFQFHYQRIGIRLMFATKIDHDHMSGLTPFPGETA